MTGSENLAGKKLGKAIRPEFPIFSIKSPSELHYLDSAASAQKPRRVIERLTKYLSSEHANIHRGAYALSAEATKSYDESKEKIAQLIGAHSQDLVFTKGATEAINLAAFSYGEQLKPGDNILVSSLEHHSNIVPWQLLERRKGIKVRFIDVTKNAELDLADFKRKLSDFKPKLVAMTHAANSFGSVLPIEEVITLSHAAGAKVLIDAAQSVQHCEVNCRALNVDFLAFSGHKIYGPTGIGILYVHPNLQESLDPYQGGGDMISYVSEEGSNWADFPQRMEAGTPPIAEAIGLGEAADFIRSCGIKRIAQFEHELFGRAWELLSRENDITLYGPATLHGPAAGKQVSIIAFNLGKIHAHDLSTVSDEFNVQIRAGHHCAMPALKRVGITSSARASIGVYSDITDFEALVEAIRAARKMFS